MRFRKLFTASQANALRASIAYYRGFADHPAFNEGAPVDAVALAASASTGQVTDELAEEASAS